MFIGEIIKKCFKVDSTPDETVMNRFDKWENRRVLLLPVFRFGRYLNSITVRTLEIYSRISGRDFNFVINVDSETYQDADEYFKSKLENLEVVVGCAGGSLLDLTRGFMNTLRVAYGCDLLLNCSEYYLSLLYSYLIHLLTGRKLVCIVNIIHSGMRNRRSLERLVCSFVLKRSFGIIMLNNESLINEFKQLFPTNRKIALTTNGVSVSDFYSSNEKSNDLLFIGIAEDRKGAFELPEIVERVRISNPGVRMKIMSRSGDLEKLHRLVKTKGLEGNIEIVTEYVNEDKKRELYARSRVFVFPSKEEGIAIVIAEALASSLPVVLFDVESLKIFSKGTLKVKEGDIDGFSSAVTKLLEDDDLRLQIGLEGRQFALDYLSYDRVALIENEAIKTCVH